MLTGFTAALTLITLSELGDKTFFISLLLATRLPRVWVFIGSLTALAAMTLISVLLGQMIGWIPARWVHRGVVVLFLGFGIKLLYTASCMSPQVGCSEAAEAETIVDQVAQGWIPRWDHLGLSTGLQAFGLTFLGEWGDRTQISTIALATAHTPLAVTLGAILGHGICAGIAVLSGRWIAGYLSERLLTAVGGLLFLCFGVLSWISGGVGSGA